MIRSNPHGTTSSLQRRTSGKRNRAGVPVPLRIGSRCIRGLEFLSVGIVAGLIGLCRRVSASRAAGKKVNIRNQGKVEA